MSPLVINVLTDDAYEFQVLITVIENCLLYEIIKIERIIVWKNQESCRDENLQSKKNKNLLFVLKYDIMKIPIKFPEKPPEVFETDINISALDIFILLWSLPLNQKFFD